MLKILELIKRIIKITPLVWKARGEYIIVCVFSSTDEDLIKSYRKDINRLGKKIKKLSKERK